MSTGLPLKMLMSWIILLVVILSDIKAREVLETSVDDVILTEHSAEDRSVGGNNKPTFDPTFNVPSSHGN